MCFGQVPGVWRLWILDCGAPEHCGCCGWFFVMVVGSVGWEKRRIFYGVEVLGFCWFVCGCSMR